MAEIGAYQARTHLPRLLERVQQGERFVITKHGHPIAELVPFSGHNIERIREALDAIRTVRRALARRKIRLKDDELIRSVSALLALPIDLDAGGGAALAAVLSIARGLGLTAYVEPAKRLTIPLATLDAKPRHACTKTGVAVLP